MAVMDYAVPLLVLAAYFALQSWILPKMGVPT
jgi:hypothetical protein